MTKNWTIEIQLRKPLGPFTFQRLSTLPNTILVLETWYISLGKLKWSLVHVLATTIQLHFFFYTRKFNLEEVWSPTISYHFNLGIVWWYSKANAYHSYIEGANLKLPVIDFIIQSSTFLHKVVLFRFLICEKLTFIHRKKQDSKLSSKQPNRVLGRAELIF